MDAIDAEEGAAERPDRTEEHRRALMEAAGSVLELAGSPEVGRQWHEPAAVEGMTVGGLAAHLVVALRMTIVLLGREKPDTDEVVTPLAFFGDNRREGQVLDDERARAIVAAAEDAGTAGQAEVVDELASVIAQVDATLAELGPGHTMATSRMPHAVARLDDYLATRCAEMVLHGDDLACSVGVVWHPPARATDVVVDLLVGMARERVGDLAVLRALAREERAEPGALRAL